MKLAAITLALTLAAGAATAADNQAGVPLAPGDAPGPWTLQSGGDAICVVTLGAARTGAGFAAQAPASCGDALPGGVAGWTPTADGLQLIGADGSTLLTFNRWSNSLFVSHRGQGADLQLMRGRPSS